MTSHRQILSCALAILAVSAVALGAQSGKHSVQAKQEPLPAQEIFKRVSPSVMVVESLDQEGKVTKFGSGVVIASGKVITNRHVIEDGVSFRVEHAGKKWPAKLMKVDPDHDLAELSVAGLDAPAVTVLDSSKLAVGETVYAIGSPEGLELTISEGLISGLREFDKGRVIQTSAAISPGSSGGGLFDSRGRLVGITTFYLKEGQSLNFALPAEWTLALNHRRANPRPAANQKSSAFQALVWFELGDISFKAEKYEVAAHDFREAIQQNPDGEIGWASWFGLASAYGGLRQYGKAIMACQEAIRLKPDDARVWFALGVAYLGLGQNGKAVAAEQSAIQMDPGNARTWYILGLALKASGKRSQVIGVYQKLKTLDPKLAEKFFREAVLP